MERTRAIGHGRCQMNFMNGEESMSDTEAKDIVRQFLSAIAASDGATMLGLMADDAVMITPGSPKVPFNGRF